MAGPVVDALFSVRFPRKDLRPGVKQYCLLYEGTLRIIRTVDREELLEAFRTHMHRVVAAGSPMVFLHAGVVAWKGKAIVLPGRTLAGKSTLVTALMRAGAEYFSDEFAVLDQEGRVHPYAKPLGIRPEGEGEQRVYSAEALGGRVGTGPLPVGAVLVTSYREGGRWRPRPMTPGQGLLTLLHYCASAQRDPGQALATLKRVVAEARLLKGSRGEAGETAELILRHFATAS